MPELHENAPLELSKNVPIGWDGVTRRYSIETLLMSGNERERLKNAARVAEDEVKLMAQQLLKTKQV